MEKPGIQPNEVRDHVRMLVAEFHARATRIFDASMEATSRKTEDSALGCLIEAGELAATLPPLLEAIRICTRMKG